MISSMEKIYMPIEHFAIHPMPLFIPMIETMCEKLNMRHYGAAVMANLEGAFGATWRIVLIYKLYKAGVKDMLLTILDNFLTNGLSRNLLNGYVSEWFESNFELPQESIFSPALFLVLTDDLAADPAKSNLQLPKLPSKHPPNESKYATYGEAAAT